MITLSLSRFPDTGHADHPGISNRSANNFTPTDRRIYAEGQVGGPCVLFVCDSVDHADGYSATLPLMEQSDVVTGGITVPPMPSGETWVGVWWQGAYLSASDFFADHPAGGNGSHHSVIIVDGG